MMMIVQNFKKNSMKLKQLPGFCLLALFALASCKKGSNPAPEPKLDTGIYLTGYQQGTPGSVLWKNGIATQPAGFTTFISRGMLVNGNDMYIGGFIGSQTPVSIAAYWKNGVIKKLTDGTSDAQVWEMVVSGKDVYAAGYVGGYFASDPNTQVLSSMIAAYWKNGVLTTLTNTGPSQAEHIIVSGTDVYVVGTVFQNNTWQSVYWKNGVLTQVGNPLNNVAIGGMAVQNNKIYIAYTETPQINTGASISYMSINGVVSQLPNDLDASGVTSLFVNGTDVYITGFVLPISVSQITAVVWKNGIPQKLPQIAGTSTPFNTASGVTVSGTDVYVTGQSQGAAVYWKNGVAVKVGNKVSSAYGIAIVH